MNWTFRAFMIAYAATWIVLAVAQGFATQVFARDSSFNDRSAFWMTIGTTAVSYAVLAFGYLTGRVKAKAPAWPWLAGVCALVLSPLVDFDWRTASGEDFAYAFSLLTYLTLAALILYEFRSKAANLNVVRRILDTTALISGCGLVLSSIFLNIATDSGGSLQWTGWSVVVRRGGWVTSGFNIGSDEGIK